QHRDQSESGRHKEHLISAIKMFKPATNGQATCHSDGVCSTKYAHAFTAFFSGDDIGEICCLSCGRKSGREPMKQSQPQQAGGRSEERRVGKECGQRRWYGV